MSQRLKTMQVLRGIAAISVLFFHYRFYLKGNDTSGSSLWDILFGWGIIGVDIFFVISGFIMVYIIHYYYHGWRSSTRFLLNRATRVIPLYYFCLLVAFLLGGAMSTFHYPEKTQNLFSALTFTVYKTNITPHYIDDDEIYNIRWTLNYEIYFYIVFALCMLVKPRLITLLIYGLLVTCIIPVFLGFQPTLSSQGYKFQTAIYGLLSNPIILEFYIGAIIGYLYISLKKQKLSFNLESTSLFISCILLIFIPYGVCSGKISALNFYSTIIISFFILAITLAEPLISNKIPNNIVYLGDISFSLYLLHNSIGMSIMKRIDTSHNNSIISWLVVLMAITASVIAAHFTHKYIEVKFTSWLKQKCATQIANTKI
ncbi:acyltransferase family protein [Candidatus Sodalis pierantonius]|uniref:acyltransferase family protein n=1 Tax=Candidatus Sodalis pierantonii TaxID=1486991 RepID=UPI00046D6945|nr:acyltransferase [Candidatus Sodalis pierantonius]